LAEADCHDPLTCGLLGQDDLCPACSSAAEREAEAGDAAAIARSASLLRDDLLRIAERFQAASDTAWRAAVAGDADAREAAESKRREAAGEYHAAREALADLGLLLLRHALELRPDAVRLYLLEALKPELQAFARAIVELEGRQ
jgi:hypothetical protein